jgi:acylglycerol lipase
MRHPATYFILVFLLAGLPSCVSIDHVETTGSGAKTEAASRTPAVLGSRGASLASDRFIAGDGVALPLRAWLPNGEPSAIVIALHGLNDYSNAFASPAQRLVAQGIAVYAYDQRGFGASPRRGRWGGESAMVEDAIVAARLLRQRYRGIPLYLLGESMGGAVAIIAVTGPTPAPVDGVILSAPGVWGRQTMNVFERVGLWFIGQMPALQFSQRSLPYRIHPSDNIAMLRALGADPLVLKEARTETLTGVVDLMSAAFARTSRLTAPVLILYGEKDEIVPRDALAAFITKLPIAARSHQHVALYPNGYHLLLRDLQSATVLTDIVAWMHDPGANLPSGADIGARAVLTGSDDSVALLN